MKRTVVGALAIAALGATALPVLAAADHGHGNERGGPHTGITQPGFPDMSGRDMEGPGMMDGGMGNMMRMMKMMHGQQGGMMDGADHVLRLFDTDGDGNVSPDEFRTGMQAELAKYDADGNGSLSLAEFETMHAAHVREATVDRFQMFDADGDGQVTADEIAAPADRMARMMRMRPGADDGTTPMAGESGSDRMMDDDGGMMDGN